MASVLPRHLNASSTDGRLKVRVSRGLTYARCRNVRLAMTLLASWRPGLYDPDSGIRPQPATGAIWCTRMRVAGKLGQPKPPIVVRTATSGFARKVRPKPAAALGQLISP